MVHKKIIGVLIKALVFGIIVLASYTILGLIGIITANLDFVIILLIGVGAFVIRETLGMFKSLRRWL